MSDILKRTWEIQAATIMKALEKRNMKGYYCPDCASAVKQAQELLFDGALVAYGGSVSLSECGILNMLQSRTDIRLLDRSKAMTAEEKDKSYHEALSSDVYFMSSNAITLDGQLINIDGRGNRVAALIYGPARVVLVAGMNKVVPTVEDGIRRVHNVATPANCLRLDLKTPCAATGACHDCLAPDCICNQVVITRRNGTPDRIHVILVGEALGY